MRAPVGSKGLPPPWSRDLELGCATKSRVRRDKLEVCIHREKSRDKEMPPVLYPSFFTFFFFSISLLFQLLTLSESLNLCTF